MRAAAPAGWRDKAKELLARGDLPLNRIAQEVGVSATSLHRFLKPQYGARQRKATAEAEKVKRTTNPVWRLRRNLAKREHYAKNREQIIERERIRRQAREEAAETGEPVEQVYERWGVA